MRMERVIEKGINFSLFFFELKKKRKKKERLAMVVNGNVKECEISITS